jgi:molybdopterin synthase sulfur carrier subunit
MKIHIKYFASVREALNKSEEEMNTHASTVAGLRSELQSRNALYAQALDTNKAVRAAVNQQICHDEDMALSEGVEVAFFPPVTGG